MVKGMSDKRKSERINPGTHETTKTMWEMIQID